MFEMKSGKEKVTNPGGHRRVPTSQDAHVQFCYDCFDHFIDRKDS